MPAPVQQALPDAQGGAVGGRDGALPPPDDVAQELTPVDETLRLAAQARADADAQEKATAADAIENADPHLNDIPELHPNVNARRRRFQNQDHGAFEDFNNADDLGASFVNDGDDFPGVPPPWLSQVINAAVTAAATAVAALPQRPSSSSGRSSMAPTKLSDRKVPDFWESKPEE